MREPPRTTPADKLMKGEEEGETERRERDSELVEAADERDGAVAEEGRGGFEDGPDEAEESDGGDSEEIDFGTIVPDKRTDAGLLDIMPACVRGLASV